MKRRRLAKPRYKRYVARKGEVFMSASCGGCGESVFAPARPVQFNDFVRAIAAASIAHGVRCEAVER